MYVVHGGGLSLYRKGRVAWPPFARHVGTTYVLKVNEIHPNIWQQRGRSASSLVPAFNAELGISHAKSLP